MKKIITITSKLILVLAFLCVFAYLVRHVNGGGTKLGIFTKPLKAFSEFPILAQNVFREYKSPSRLIDIDPDFHPLNNVKYDIFPIYSYYDNSEWIITLSNLKNDSIIHRWHLNEKDYHKTTERIFSHARIIGTILLEDRSIVLQNTKTFNLFRLDRESEIIWHNTDHLFHHSMELDNEGNVWVCTREIIDFLEDKESQYLDDYITKIDVENGNTLYNKSVREILIENDLAYLVYGIGNQIGVATNLLDPLHINDIEPALKDGSYWKAGDLFLSLRHRSMILLYRPSTNRVLRVITGSFFNQHDVDIQSDSTISLFNNNVSYFASTSNTNNQIAELQPFPNPFFDKFSEVLNYNFSDSTFTTIYPGQFLENKILTQTSGIHHFLSNGDLYVESENEGKVYIFNENELILKTYINTVIDKQVESPNCVRIYENINF